MAQLRARIEEITQQLNSIVVYAEPDEVAGTNAIEITPDETFANNADMDGVVFVCRAENDNTGDMTFKVGTRTTRTLRDRFGEQIPANGVIADQWLIVVYSHDARQFFGLNLPAGGGGLQRESTLPDADDADENAIYAEVDSDNVILNDVLKVKSFKPSEFFAMTAADLGDGHRGYAGSGYGSLDSGYDVDAGGSAGYSALGAVSEHHNSMLNANFERVGTYTGISTGGLASYNGNLYYPSGINSQIRGFNPDDGTQSLFINPEFCNRPSKRFGVYWQRGVAL